MAARAAGRPADARAQVPAGDTFASPALSAVTSVSGATVAPAEAGELTASADVHDMSGGEVIGLVAQHSGRDLAAGAGRRIAGDLVEVAHRGLLIESLST